MGFPDFSPMRVNSGELVEELASRGVRFARGVSDSALAGVERALEAASSVDVAPCSCEAQAASEVAGHALVSGGLGLLYLQNSGLGAIMDTMTSLWHVPCVMVVSWRGRPGRPDAAQHLRMGEVTEPVLDAMGVRHVVLDGRFWRRQVAEACSRAELAKRPFALLVPSDLLERQDGPSAVPVAALDDIDVVGRVLVSAGPHDVVVTSVGNISRLFGSLVRDDGPAWLPVCGAMGSVLPIAASVAHELPGSKVFCVEGDGSAAMGAAANLSLVGRSPRNLVHVVIVNDGYGTFGGRAGVTCDAMVSYLWSASPGPVDEVWDVVGLISALRLAMGSGAFVRVVARTSGHDGERPGPVDFEGRVEEFRKKVAGWTRDM